MKSYIDFFETFKGEMLGAKRFRNRFIKRWGVTTLDGVEVLNERFTIYPGHTSSRYIQSMCKMLGMWSQVRTAKFNTIAGYYLWLNPTKGEPITLIKELLAEKVDEFCPLGEEQEATISYIDKSDPSRFDGWTKAQVLTYIDNDYRNIFSSGNGFVVDDTLVEGLMGKYVLFDDGTEFDVEVLESSITPIQHNPGYRYDEDFSYRRTKKTYYTGLSITIKYSRKVAGISPTGLLITTMLAEQQEERQRALAELQKSSRVDNEDGYSPVKPKVTNTIWYQDRLRLSAIRADGIKTSIALDAILGSLDTGQIQKSVKWYKKILGFVLIVIAIVLSFLYPPAGWALATVVATYVGIAMLIMTMIQAQWAKTNAAAAGYMGRWVKIANIISMVAGIASLYQSLAKQALAQTVAQEMVKQGATQEVARQAAQAMSQAALQQFAVSASLEVTTGAMLEAVKTLVMKNLKSIAMKVVAAAAESRQKEMNTDLENKSKQLEDSNEQLDDMLDKNLHIGVEDIKWYTDQSGLAQSRYDVNHLYEGEPKGIHIGNVCRATFYNGKSLNLRAEDLA